MTYHLPALGEARSIGDQWGIDRLVPYGEGHSLYAITFEGTGGRIPETVEGLVTLGMVVGEASRKVGYLWNVQAIFISPGEFWRVDVVVDPAEGQFVRFTGWDTLRESVEKELAARGIAPKVSLLHVLELTGSDAKQFSTAGGIAPFVVCTQAGCSPTKAASAPHPKQMMRGVIEQVSSAVPLSLGQVVGAAVPGWVWPALAAVAIGAWWLSSQTGRYTPNESCPHCPGGRVPR